ncbi:MAG: NTP transferase domain-containing protein [Myxococcales bacterium]|nr:NTP transferase domain-containing protein [Myxococcales bacterium]
MAVLGIIQARLGSTRLPSKILAPLAGRPMLELISHRLRLSRVQEWWLATSSDPADDVTESWGHGLGLRVFRGEDENVLSRFTAIIREREPEWIVRITADNPFISAEAVDLLLDARVPFGKDHPLIEFVAKADGSHQLPLGFGPQLARAEAVLASEDEIPEDQPHHRTHVLSWLAQSCAAKCCPVPDHWPARPEWRWTVDTFADLAMARSAFALFEAHSSDRAIAIHYSEMVALLDAHPEIVAQNNGVEQKQLVEG